jgi:hypothetical protein
MIEAISQVRIAAFLSPLRPRGRNAQAVAGSAHDLLEALSVEI